MTKDEAEKLLVHYQEKLTRETDDDRIAKINGRIERIQARLTKWEEKLVEEPPQE